MRAIFNYCLLVLSLSVNAQTPLPIPDTLSGPNYTLTMHKDSVQFFPGEPSRTYSYNQYPYLGPTLIFNKGTDVNITIHNQIDDTTTVHWHGIHLPAMADGGPHTPIMPGQSSNPMFSVMDHAATYWYHPHMHMKTAEQAIKGAAGLIIVRDPIEAALTLPRTYGVDDIPLIIQCLQFDSMNQGMALGMQDSTILVNGAQANNGHEVVANLPAQVVRLRLLNASGERAFLFGLSNNLPFSMITSDGGLLDAPVLLTRIRLAPGERAEILVDLSGKNGQTVYLKSYASELPIGVQGGPTMPMPPGSPPMDSPLNGIDFNILKIAVGAQTTNPITSIPTSLTTNTPYLPSSANQTRTIRFTADNIMVMDGPFYFNDKSFDMMRIDFMIPINNIEIWKLVNETMVAHPFHIHDVQFYLLDRNGIPPSAEEAGRKDVVLIPTGDSIQFITQFSDFQDTMVPYMYHCHILMHEDAGMMGQFLVVPEGYVGLNKHLVKTQTLQVYPNPTTDYVNFNLPPEITSFDVRITDIAGKIVYRSDRSHQSKLDVSQLPPGAYTILIRSDQSYFSSTLIKH